jgi:SOS response regulatory protein OraA/RecX
MSDALETALGALRYRDLSEAELEQRLATRGFAEHERGDAIATLRRTGLLDDHRFAQGRAASLVGRGAGDALIRDALERVGVPPEVVDDALEALEPEAERARVIAERRGRGPKTARYLNGKGFSGETVAEFVASERPDELG